MVSDSPRLLVVAGPPLHHSIPKYTQYHCPIVSFPCLWCYHPKQRRCSAAEFATFNALRHSGAVPGDLVAVLGIGGLGHMGIQFANKFGYRVTAVGRGPENATLAKKRGARVYIDNEATNAAKELQDWAARVAAGSLLNGTI